MAELTNPEKRMLRVMQKRDEKWKLDEILEACDWDDQAIAVAAGHGLSNHGYVKISESSEAFRVHLENSLETFKIQFFEGALGEP